ncbi:MAG: response regulator transcription factor [Chloroflexia bacterium]|nr:response regulator transcription factor [Chloroflexia bacterium]
MITLLLVDDQPTTRLGLRMLLGLEPDITVVGEAGDGGAALDLARTLKPDVIVMDVAMPGMDGIAATWALRTVAPNSAVVILSLQDDAATRKRARDAGAFAFVAKHQQHTALLGELRQAAAMRHVSQKGGD